MEVSVQKPARSSQTKSLAIRTMTLRFLLAIAFALHTAGFELHGADVTIEARAVFQRLRGVEARNQASAI